MRVFLIIISVIMIYIRLVFSKTRTVKDLTDQCVNGRHIAQYLTTGAGETDFYLGMIASNGKINCSIEYFVTESNHVLVYLEFPDTLAGRKVCLPEVNSVIMVSGALQVKICDRLNLLGENTYKNMAPNKIVIIIESQAELNTIKMTATALRDPLKSKCTDKEVGCTFKAKTFCMHSETLCDGFANCGVPSAYDEDVDTCQGSRITPVVIISSIIMTIVSFWLIIAIVMVVIPKRRETFIYRFDETTSVVDVEMGYDAFDINVEVLFPEEEERENARRRTQKSFKSNKNNRSSYF